MIKETERTNWTEELIMGDEDSDEEFVSWAAVVSCLLFSFNYSPKKQQHTSHEWLSDAFHVSFFDTTPV